MKVMLIGVFVAVFVTEVKKLIKSTKKYKTVEEILEDCDKYSGADLVASILTIIVCLAVIPILMVVQFWKTKGGALLKEQRPPLF